MCVGVLMCMCACVTARVRACVCAQLMCSRGEQVYTISECCNIEYQNYQTPPTDDVSYSEG